MKTWLKSLAALTISLSASSAFAWNNVGHMTVAEIAWRRLSPEERAKIADILKAHPHYTTMLLKDKPADADEAEYAFVVAATWPDLVRPGYPGEKPKAPSITKFHHADWHYITRTFMRPAKGDDAGPTTKPTAGGEPTPNILTALTDNDAALKAAGTGAEDRAVALAWVVHLVGDIHQPLHVCSMASADAPTGDKGGNDDTVRVESKGVNLHSFWDEQLGTATDLNVIHLLADNLTTNPSTDVGKMAETAADTNFASWADESFIWAKTAVYLNGKIDFVPSKDWKEKKYTLDQVPGLPVGYAANARLLAERRVALAGYRLAETLKADLHQ